MALITKRDTNGIKPLLQEGELAYDKYAAGGDVGRVYVGTGTANIAQARKDEVDAVKTTADTHVARTDNPHATTKAQVGLGNVDNTSDVDKPISTAAQAALDNTVKLTGNQTIAGVKTFQNEIISKSNITAGQDSGSVALTVNDGYGNANVAFNHNLGIPDIEDGSSARITATVGTPTASMQFQLRDNTEKGTVQPLVPVMTLREDSVTVHKPLIVPTPTAGNHAVNKDYVYTKLETYTKAEVNTALDAKADVADYEAMNLDRADKYLANQNVVNMAYNVDGKLVKVQYSNATDVDYETLGYNVDGKLDNVAHYVGGVLQGNTVLSYTNGKLVSAPFVGV